MSPVSARLTRLDEPGQVPSAAGAECQEPFFLVPKLRFGNAPPGNSVSFYNAIMTRTRYRIFETEYAYFLTCTIVGWVPLFTRPEGVDILFDSWRFLQKNRHFLLYGYVVLENHLHLVASAPDLA